MEKITNSKWYIELTSWVFKIFIVLTFFFPMYYSDFRRHMYFIGLLWPYVALFFGMGLIVLGNMTSKWENCKFAIWQMILLILYAGTSIYMDKHYHHWMWEEIHNSVAFAFLILLFLYPKWHEKLNFDLIAFLLRVITLSMFCAIVFYYLGYQSVQFHNNEIVFTTQTNALEKFGEHRLSWIYYHKSQFAMMQLVFIGFAYRNREKFTSKVYYALTQLVFVLCLVLAHSWTAVGALGVLFVGIFLDWYIAIIRKRQISKETIMRMLIWGVVLLTGVAVIIVILVRKIQVERAWGTLGHRIPIWTAGINYIKNNPMGVGQEFGKNILKYSSWFYVSNCHNVFLNALFRFSIPVGILFTVIVLGFMVQRVWSSKTWFAVGYIVSILMLMCMDYSLLSYGVASFLMLIYYTLEPIADKRPKKESVTACKEIQKET